MRSGPLTSLLLPLHRIHTHALQVEATLSRALLRAGGTVVGGSLGLAVLAGEGLRHSPVGLQALVCALSFVVRTVAAAAAPRLRVIVNTPTQSVVVAWRCSLLSLAARLWRAPPVASYATCPSRSPAYTRNR